MERLIRWFVNNGVAANLLMAFIIIAGALTIPLLKMEVFPEIEIEIINVSAVYPGASPSDVEDAICIRIEERLQGLDGIKQISSNASENIGSVNVEILPGQDASQMLDRIKAQVDAIDTFPEDVERPAVRQFVGSNPVLTIAVDGDVGETALNGAGDETAARYRRPWKRPRQAYASMPWSRASPSTPIWPKSAVTSFCRA